MRDATRRERWMRLQEGARTMRTWGDCYGYLLVATGRADIMVDEVIADWDGAALMPIVAEAGGVKQYVQFLRNGVVGVAAKDGKFLWHYAKGATVTNCSTPIAYDGCIFASDAGPCSSFSILPNAPNNTFSADRFMARHISSDRRKPEVPSSEPVMI